MYGYVEVRLTDIGYFYSGLNGKSKKDFENGNSKFISYMNVFSNPSINLDTNEKVYIDKNEKQNIVEYGDIIFTGSSETKEEAGMSSVLTKHTKENLYLNSFSFGYRLYDNSLLSPQYSKHLFRSHQLRKQIIKTASGVTRFNVSKKKMENIIICLPSLNQQIKISKLLDNFYSLCSDLENGLPAEIEARQKQYEFYRDKLLSFKELK